MKPNNIYCGIDIGFTGAIAFIEMSGDAMIYATFYDMPVTNDAKGRSLVDAIALRGILKDGQPSHACHEVVGAMPSQGVSSMFRFGQGYGTVQAVLALSGVPYTGVLPNAWKKATGVNGEKDYARTQAIARFPFLSNDLKLKKHSGRADAFWIAYYAYLKANK